MESIFIEFYLIIIFLYLDKKFQNSLDLSLGLIIKSNQLLFFYEFNVRNYNPRISVYMKREDFY